MEFSLLGQRAEPPVIVDLMARALANPELLSLAAGFTDNAVLPRELVAEATAALSAAGHADEPLQYGPNQGRKHLRELSCQWLGAMPNECSDAFDADKIVMTNGSQQALYLAIQAICDPGDIVLVEEPSYFVCLEMLKGLGLKTLGIPCDETGAVRLEELNAVLADLNATGKADRVKAVYLVSYFGNPSSRSMELDEKLGIAEVLLGNGFCIPIIEDAAYRELYFEQAHPVPSIMSLEAFKTFPKLYLGTYTKPLATGLKVGFGYCSHADWLSKMMSIKGHQDFGSAHFNQAIVEYVLQRGLYARHLEKIQRHYARKAGILEAALISGGLHKLGWSWETPRGGMIFWLRAPDGLDVRMDSSFCQECIRQGVLYVPGELCSADGGLSNCLRLSSGALPEDRLREAVDRFVRVARNHSVSF